jgi:hypothetical protein
MEWDIRIYEEFILRLHRVWKDYVWQYGKIMHDTDKAVECKGIGAPEIILA